MYDGAPRALADLAEQERRLADWHGDPQHAPLREYIEDIQRRGRTTPVFDPADGGTASRTLLVLEAPGPMSDAGKGSGIISVDNSDQTATNCWRARSEAGLVADVMHWNLVPWFLGPASKKPSDVEVADGAVRLRYLLDLLPELQTVVLCGEFAKRGWREWVAPLIDGNGPTVISTWHPSPSSLNFGNRRAEFTEALRKAALLA